jgi:hypothetical protein
MWCYCKILKFRLIKRTMNEAVLGRTKENKVLWYTIKVQSHKMIGHI